MITIDKSNTINILELVDDIELFNDVKENLELIIAYGKDIIKGYPDILDNDFSKKYEKFKYEGNLKSKSKNIEQTYMNLLTSLAFLKRIKIGYNINLEKFESNINNVDVYTYTIEVSWTNFCKNKIGNKVRSLIESEYSDSELTDLLKLIIESYKKRVVNLYSKKTDLLYSNNIHLFEIADLLDKDKIISQDIGIPLTIAAVYKSMINSGTDNSASDRKQYLSKLIKYEDLTHNDVKFLVDKYVKIYDEYSIVDIAFETFKFYETIGSYQLKDLYGKELSEKYSYKDLLLILINLSKDVRDLIYKINWFSSTLRFLHPEFKKPADSIIKDITEFFPSYTSQIKDSIIENDLYFESDIYFNLIDN